MRRKPGSDRPEATGKPVAGPGGRRPPRATIRHQAKAEEMFHGARACAALFARRPEAIIRVYVDEQRRDEFRELLGWCARNRKGFQVVGEDNLAKLTGSIHHEGIAILAKALPRWGLAELMELVPPGRSATLLYLDGVQNPHNLGSILRTAAHFGATAIVGRAGELPPVSPAAVRVAEGAAEFVPVCALADPATDLGRLRRAGFRVVTTSSHAGDAPDAAVLGGRSVLVLGAEGQGVSAALERLADARVRIPGTGAVESLNVAVACGVLLAAAWRQRE